MFSSKCGSFSLVGAHFTISLPARRAMGPILHRFFFVLLPPTWKVCPIPPCLFERFPPYRWQQARPERRKGKNRRAKMRVGRLGECFWRREERCGFSPPALNPLPRAKSVQKTLPLSSSPLYVLFCHRTRVGPPDAGVEWSGGDLTSFPKKSSATGTTFFSRKAKRAVFANLISTLLL